MWYLLFVYGSYYPAGGAKDFIASSGSVQSLKSAGEREIARSLDEDGAWLPKAHVAAWDGAVLKIVSEAEVDPNTSRFVRWNDLVEIVYG